MLGCIPKFQKKLPDIPSCDISDVKAAERVLESNIQSRKNDYSLKHILFSLTHNSKMGKKSGKIE